MCGVRPKSPNLKMNQIYTQKGNVETIPCLQPHGYKHTMNFSFKFRESRKQETRRSPLVSVLQFESHRIHLILKPDHKQTKHYPSQGKRVDKIYDQKQVLSSSNRSILICMQYNVSYRLVKEVPI